MSQPLIRLRSVVQKELRQMRRNPVLIRMLIIAPILQLIMFGYTATTDVRNVPVVICDQSRSPESRALADKVRVSACFVLTGHVEDPRDLKFELDAGRAQIALHIPLEFAKDLRRGRPASVAAYVDGSDSVTATVAMGYMAGLLEHYGAALKLEQLKRAGVRRAGPRVESVPRVWYNPELRSMNFMIPGVFGLIIFVITVVWTGQSIVRERELGTLEQLLVTPVRPLELMLGKSVPYAVAGLVDAGVIVLVARFWFGVPLQGSVALLFALAAVFILTTLGLGLLVSTVSQTQQQALLATFFLVMPSVLLSGFFFPIENMPWIIQQASYLIPFRYFLEITRGIFLKGVGLHVLWPQAVTLTAFGIALFAAGALAFRKRLQ